MVPTLILNSANDMVAAGNSDPKYRGTGGFTAEYKGIGLALL